MALIVALTGGFGLLSSFTMLNLGVDLMALRYPIALGCAYLFFLIWLWLWLWLWLRTKADDYLGDIGVPGGPSGSGAPPAPPEFASGNGGNFGGGGASGAFDTQTPAPASLAGRTPPSVSTESTAFPDRATFSLPDADADELTIPLVVSRCPPPSPWPRSTSSPSPRCSSPVRIQPPGIDNIVKPVKPG